YLPLPFLAVQHVPNAPAHFTCRPWRDNDFRSLHPRLYPQSIGPSAAMELRELRNFMRVARAGSVSRAAKELRLAQPALSRQIKKLEHELGVPLFSRHGRGVRLSAAGSLLLERAEAIAQLVHQTSEEIREERSPARGRITLGVPPIGGRLVIPHFVERFQ